MNIWIGVGRLTKDADLRYSQNGTPIATFTIAIDREYQKDKENKKTDFIYCKAFGARAEKYIGPYFHKGDLVEVRGEYNIDNYEKEGEKRQFHSINVQHAKVLHSKNYNQDRTVDTQEPYMDDLYPLDGDESELHF